MSESVLAKTSVGTATMADITYITTYKDVYNQKSLAYKFVKRAFDIVASSFALIVLSPLLILTALAIVIEDGGPVFFTQQRAGKNLKPFKIYKFRSMYRDAEAQFAKMQEQNEQTGHAFKIKDDPRVTKVGKFIRKYSIDELPQLLNIIKGDMSIVGPRPILQKQMEECNPYEKQRLIVRPGLTCYWQVGGRANIKWEEWVELDLRYIRDMNAWEDIKLIFRTIPAVFDSDGAY